MRIALISPPFYYKKFEENLRVVSEEFGKYPPINLAYAAAILEKGGHEVKIIDAHALELSKEEVLRIIKRFNPGLIGYDLHSTYMFHDALSFIRYIKDKTGIKTMVGGLNIELYQKEVMNYPEIDYGLMGSIRDNINQFVEKIENKENLSPLKGIAYKKGEKIIVQEPESYSEDLESLPFPARHLLPNDKYYQYISKKKNFTVMLSAVGCPYPCNFCVINNVKFKARSAKNVVDEMEECYNKHGIREIDFFDAVFTINKKRVLEICEEIKKRKLKVDWSCRARVDNVDEEMLKAMAEAGCVRIYYGIESVDKDILKGIKKEISMDQVVSAIKTTKKYKIKALGFFMIGNQGETKESIRKNVEFAKKLKLDYIQFSRTIAKPSSELDKEMIKKTGKDYWRDYVKGIEKERWIDNMWCDLSEKELEEETKKAYKAFYMRPSYILKALYEIKSLHELKRYIKAGTRMIKNEAKK